MARIHVEVASAIQRTYQRPERQWPVKFRPEERIRGIRERARGTSLLPWDTPWSLCKRKEKEKKNKDRRRERERNVQSGALIGKKEEAPLWRGRVERELKGERGNSLDGGLLEATMEPVPRFFSKRPGLRST